MAEDRVPYQGSTRKARLPADWEARKAEALRRNPRRICHWCGETGGHDLDHIIPGDDHSPDNLDWIHGRNDVRYRGARRNCHGEKTGAEGAAARPRLRRPPEVHPGLR